MSTAEDLARWSIALHAGKVVTPSRSEADDHACENGADGRNAQRRACGPGARSPLRITWNHFYLGGNGLCAAALPLSNAAKRRVGKHLLRDRSALHMAYRQRQCTPKAAKTSGGRAVPDLAAGSVPGKELQSLAVRARRCIRKSIPAARGGALKTTVVSTRLTKGNCGGDQIE